MSAPPGKYGPRRYCEMSAEQFRSIMKARVLDTMVGFGCSIGEVTDASDAMDRQSPVVDLGKGFDQ